MKTSYRTIECKSSDILFCETEKGYSVYWKGQNISSGISKWKIESLIKQKINFDVLSQKIVQNTSKCVDLINQELDDLNEKDVFYKEVLTESYFDQTYEKYKKLTSESEQRKSFIKEFFRKHPEIKFPSQIIDENKVILERERTIILSLEKSIREIELCVRVHDPETFDKLQTDIRILNMMILMKTVDVQEYRSILYYTGEMYEKGEPLERFKVEEWDLQQLEKRRDKLKNQFKLVIVELIHKSSNVFD